MKNPNFTLRVADSKPKRRQDDGRWSQDLLLQVRSSTGSTRADWATLTFSKQEGYGITYNRRLEMAFWVEGLYGIGVLHLLDEYVNGRAEQDCDQTDEQMAVRNDEDLSAEILAMQEALYKFFETPVCTEEQIGDDA
jgi:hypothetical protein